MSFIKTSIFAAFVAMALISPGISAASPVSFKDGYGVMSAYSEDRFDTELNYSLTSRYALGISTINLFNYEKGIPRFEFVQFNHLVKRWNELESQANIYLSLGAGVRHFDNDNSVAGLIAVEGNYETRRIYTSLLTESLQSESDLDFNRVRCRLGVAPYLAHFESLQTWLIGQFEYTPDQEDTFTTTPILRFFYNNLALELGASLDGDIFIGTMLHF